ncbi:Multiple resistance and pH homeostasis protein C [Jannaschia seosinensis]|uniref:Multiple resistance and pH homeostasis protein C n=1 Tax=Jannaschia seosinensis TaxID=313367 RepID=A0A0M7BFP4_9RHOB|nr:NADH-quinone oxidoreductase subunit K [Jannaschia seosinensis]CUH40146.1 Multiple resistance and pH homeostasis protein C [Jannaschia seosinensis]
MDRHARRHDPARARPSNAGDDGRGHARRAQHGELPPIFGIVGKEFLGRARGAGSALDDGLRFLFGLILISIAANRVILASGGLTAEAPPLVEYYATLPPFGAANTLPQALVLTALMIGFGLFAFTRELVYRAHREIGTLNSDGMRIAEPHEEGHS